MTAFARVADLADQIRGVTYAKEDATSSPRPGYLPVLRAGNIADDGLVFDDLVFVPAERVAPTQKIRRNDVVIAASSGSLDVVGKAARALADFEGGFGAFCKVLRPRPGIDPAYFAHFFRTREYRQRVSALAAGANINNLRNEHLDDFKIPLPPLPEQRRIAEMLDEADALRAKRRAALAQLDTLTQSIFLDMFGDPAANAKGWPAITLGDALIAIRNGANAEQREEPGGWPITRIETISDGTINPERVRWIEPDESLVENFRLEPGDILFSHINSVEHIGKTALYSGTPTPLIHGINLLRLRPKLEFVDPVWLLHLLKHDFVRTHFRTRCKRAVNQASLNQPDIKSVRTFLPPLSLQHAFARRVAALQSLECAHRASLAAQDSLVASLQHRAFRGEL
ncbi:restriction endonuclease subunit S [Immundisolibacter sp.]